MHIGTGSLQGTSAGSNAAMHAGSPDEPRAFPCLIPPWELLSPLSPPGFPYGFGWLHTGRCLSQLCKQYPTVQVTVRAAPLACLGAVLSSSGICPAQARAAIGAQRQGTLLAGLLRWHAALPGVFSVNICTFGYPSLRDHLQEVPFWQRFPNTWPQASSRRGASVPGRSGCHAQERCLRSRCLRLLPVCTVRLWGPVAGGETITPTRLACFARGKKGWAVWQHPCRETVGSRLGRGGWTLMSLVVLRVPGDAALPPALQTPC